MKKFLSTLNARFYNFEQKMNKKLALALAPVAALLATATPVFAVGNTDPDALVTSIINVVLRIAKYIGMVLVVTGVFQLVMAYKDDNADAKTRGVQLAICGVILIGLQAVLQAAGIL